MTTTGAEPVRVKLTEDRLLRSQGAIPGMWVIPNGVRGQLWTPRVFETRGEAVNYWTSFWGDSRALPKTHEPVRATVTVKAAIEEVQDGR